MNAFDELIDKLKNIESDLIITLSDVINDNSDKLEEAQKNQMSLGKNIDNKNIGRLKIKATQIEKRQQEGKHL